MPNDEVDRFGEALIRLVRDPTIQECDFLMDGSIKGPSGERWRDLSRGADARRALHGLIPEVVDETLFRLLDMIDNDELALALRTSEGSYVPLYDLGMSELAGWFVGSPGWRHAYSKQRFADDFADLDLPDEPPGGR